MEAEEGSLNADSLLIYLNDVSEIK